MQTGEWLLISALIAFFILWFVFWRRWRGISAVVAVGGGFISSSIIATVIMAGIFVLIDPASSSPSAALPVISSGQQSPEQTEKIQTAVKTLLEECRVFSRYVADYESVTGEVVDRNAELYSEFRYFGWREFVRLVVVVKQNPQQIPPEFRAQRQHCHFSVHDRVIVTAKQACAKICGGANATLDETFRVVQ
jgi:hypothetical protein